MEVQNPEVKVESPPVESGAQPQETQQKTVSWEDHQRALADLNKFKTRFQKLETEQKTKQDQELKQREQWKTLAEQKEQEAKRLQGELESVKDSFLNEKKFGSLREEALRLGLRQEAVGDLETLDLSEMQVETTSTGRINILNAKMFAEKIKAIKPHWFQQQSTVINASNPRVVDNGNSVVTAKDVFTAETAYRKSQSSEDLKRYKDLVLKFQTQSRSK